MKSIKTIPLMRIFVTCMGVCNGIGGNASNADNSALKIVSFVEETEKARPMICCCSFQIERDLLH